MICKHCFEPMEFIEDDDLGNGVVTQQEYSCPNCNSGIMVYLDEDLNVCQTEDLY